MSKKISILSWNVNGIRAVWKKGFREWLTKANPDILCLQETKAQLDQLTKELTDIQDYKYYFFSAEKKGYSGVAVFSKVEPLTIKYGIGDPRFDRFAGKLGERIEEDVRVQENLSVHVSRRASR